MAVRNTESGEKVKEAILKENPNAKIDVMELDLSSMGSVRKFAEDFKSLDLPLNLLINNAGVMACPFTLSQDNIELQFATNHLGHFLLTNLLLETMKNTAQESHKEGRIVNVSSLGHNHTYKEGIHFDHINDKTCYKAWSSYGQSKLANILHANELANYIKKEGVEITANSLHPGAIATNLMRHLGYINVFFYKKNRIEDRERPAAKRKKEREKKPRERGGEFRPRKREEVGKKRGERRKEIALAFVTTQNPNPLFSSLHHVQGKGLAD